MDETPFEPPPRQPLPALDYDTPPRADHVSRRRYMGVLLAMILLAGVLGGVVILMLLRSQTTTAITATRRPAAVRITPTTAQLQAAQQAAQRTYQQQQLDQLLSSTFTPLTIVYEEEPVTAARLFAAGGMREAARSGMSQPLHSAFQPPIFRPAPFERDHTNVGGLLFAHERTSTGGNRRLVLMEMDVQLQPKNRSGDECDVQLNRTLKYRICETKVLANAPRVLRYGQSLKLAQESGDDVIPIRWVEGSLRALREPKHNLRIFAGQPDAKDKSHFTIEYMLGGKRNTIDAWLTDDDFLRVIPRGGTVKGGTWHINADVPSEATK